jgi:general secretion pathway protein F
MRFLIKGVQNTGLVVRLSVEAADADSARRAVTSQGLAVLALLPANPLLAWMPRRRTRFSLDLFGQQLVALMESGLSLVECIETLAEKEEHRPSAAALIALRGHLYRGQSFSAGLEQLPEFFPSLFVATVRAAERTGDIHEAIARYLQYQEQLDRVRRKLIAALAYPLLLLVVGLAVGAFLMFYVVPKFSGIYEELGNDLPWLTRMLLQWGRLLETHAVSTMMLLALAAAGIVLGLKQPAFRQWLGQRLWQVPAIGNRLRVYELARLYRNLGMLLQSGIPLPTALEMARDLLTPFLRDGMDRAVREIREGQSISRSLRQHGLTTPVAMRLLTVGERSGNMPHACERIAAFHESDLARWVDWFTRLVEPALMVLIGGMIGFIVVLLYLPIFELAESVR